MKNQQEIAPLAITMGDPAGVGPELVARLWLDRQTNQLPPFVYFGAEQSLKAHVEDVPTKVIEHPDEALGVYESAVPVLEIPLKTRIVLGTPSPENGEAVVKAISSAVSYAKLGHVSAVVTAPIHKAVLYKAGFDAPGHTEYLARLCDMPDDHSVMMLTARNLRVVPVTIHIGLAQVAKNLTTEKIIHAGMVTAHDLKKRFKIDQPRLAVAGLNPHAGEEGTMGMEEATHIQPAVWALRDMGINVTEPLPADTLFHDEARKQYDAVLCMYHDQALIPVKTLDFWGGVNATLGLPIIRTSPDHGTAHNLAGKGIARTESMQAAIKLAHEMAVSEAEKDG